MYSLPYSPTRTERGVHRQDSYGLTENPVGEKGEDFPYSRKLVGDLLAMIRNNTALVEMIVCF
ncbi:hypothetical protein KDW_30920 [Dictyobacter vulcani]|uniref:Uncharacterized protein n=1 Tax=Dictyobacter vulcani TaxID=2607529 RepID=A0A5J4KR62_9CHLR|nr:hypothetical protein KDW_30920 [Dictyobacter vulcani]